MTLASDMLTGADSLYGALASPAVHVDRSGAKTSVSAILVHDLQQYGEVADITGKTAAVSVRVSDLAFPPRRGEQYIIGGKTYTVDSLVSADELEHTVLVA